MSQQDHATIYPASDAFQTTAEIGPLDYERLYRQSVAEPDAFWAPVAERLDWFTKPTVIKDVSYRVEDFRIRWYADGELNVAVNCVDRHLATRADKTAIIWEGDDPGEARHICYRELHAEVCRLASALRNLGIGMGDRVRLYLPMIPETAGAMLACTRIGAIHSVVFGGVSQDTLAGRIADCESKLIIAGARKFPSHRK